MIGEVPLMYILTLVKLVWQAACVHVADMIFQISHILSSVVTARTGFPFLKIRYILNETYY